MSTIALFGAGGKMGCRIADKMKPSSHRVLHVEVSPAGIERLAQRGLSVTPQDEAVRQADVVILAVPDVAIGKVACQVVPVLRSGAMVICLDPAAPHSGELPARGDITYFVTHPCHPPVIKQETDPEAMMDFFGGKATQAIVCALMQGPESDYARGEAICREIFAPVMRAHRVTVEQMALLEPAMSETVAATCVMVIREAMDEAIRRGVPAEAARDFMLGHIGVDVAILFNVIDARFSDGAVAAVQRGKKRIFREDWKQVFEPDALLAEVKAIAQARNTGRQTCV